MEYHIEAVAFENNRLLTHERLESVVREYLRDGWEPLGAPLLNQDMFYQALIRRQIANENRQDSLGQNWQKSSGSRSR